MTNPLSYYGATPTSVIINSDFNTTEKIMLIVARIIYKKVINDTSSSTGTIDKAKFSSLLNDMSEMEEFKGLAEHLQSKYGNRLSN